MRDRQPFFDPLPAPLARLGSVSVTQFLRRTWHREPLLVRQAIPGFTSPVTRDDLFALAQDEEVESRLVEHDTDRWRLRHGPFSARAARAAHAFPGLRRKGWTVLVQGVDLRLPAVASLAARFRFLPRARFDDVMISYATDGGGVGPHVDQYDVFLLQAQGRRRWRIAEHFDPRLREGAPLRLLANFHAEREWVLEPGDLLYLPPGVAHDGVAQGESITISIGFRVPTRQELADAWAERQGRTAPLPGHLPDTLRRRATSPARLPDELVRAARAALRNTVPTARQLRQTLLEHCTEPKPQVFFDPPRPPITPARFAQRIRRGGLAADLRSRMLYSGPDFAINGELQEALRALPAADRRRLRMLAEQGRLPPESLAGSGTPAGVSAALRDRGIRRTHSQTRVTALQQPSLDMLLYAWYRNGWLHLFL